MDLFAVAARNANRLEDRVGALAQGMTAEDRERLERFMACVERDGRISINMRQSVLLAFLTNSTYRNTYQLAQVRSARTGRDIDEVLKKQLGDFYEPRKVFDQLFEGGERFLYGALNMGGPGATHYGDSCAVIKADTTERHETAYLRADSLKTYFREGQGLDRAAVEQDAAPHSHRQHLAALKHASDLPGSQEGRWAALLCSRHEFVEAIFAGGLTPTDLQGVRMLKSDHELHWDLAFENFRTKLSEGDRALVDNFVTIVEYLERHGIPLEVVDDA